jgi:predicted nuclease of predicted toxin-antitoxin system
VKLKLDENIGTAGADILRSAAHDVVTVREQHLQGLADDVLFGVCLHEQRSLVTLDHGFARLLRFGRTTEIGIAVLGRDTAAAQHPA